MRTLIALSILIIMQSCVYYPLMHYSVAQNVPLISKKGDGQISLSTGTQTFGLQGAYGITNSISAMGSISNGVDDIIGDGNNLGINSLDNGMRQSGELAIGFHNLLSHNVLFEIYGGAERYYRSYSISAYQFSDSFSTNITKPFIQMDIGFLNDKRNGLGISFKFGDLIYNHYSNKQTGNAINFYPDDASNKGIIEPCITYRFGGSSICCQLQLGTTFLTNVSSSFYLNDVFASAGLHVRF